MLKHRPSDSGTITSRAQNPQNSSTKPKRQPLNPVVVDLVKAGLRAEYDGYRGLAEMHFDFAEALAGVLT